MGEYEDKLYQAISKRNVELLEKVIILEKRITELEDEKAELKKELGHGE